MNASLTFVLIVALLCAAVQAFVMPSAGRLVRATAGKDLTTMMACRRNNKTEKRKRNREYARKFQSKTGGSRRKVVVEEKRAVVASNEEKFQAQVFKLTTDDDMPAYSGFDFIA